MIDHTPLLLQARTEVLAEHEVRRPVAVQVTDLLTPHPEAPLAAAAVAGLDARPGSDLLCYAFAGRIHRLASVPASRAGAQWQLVLGPATDRRYRVAPCFARSTSFVSGSRRGSFAASTPRCSRCATSRVRGA